MGITQEQIHKEKARAMDLVAQYRDGLYREPQLRSLFLELTMTCNSRCFHCGSRCETGVPSGLPKKHICRSCGRSGTTLIRNI